MNTILTNPKKTAILGACLCLPIAISISLLWFNIEPPVGILRNAPNDQADVLGSLFVLGLALLLPGALVIVLAPVMRRVHAGNKITAYPVSLLLAAVILFFIS
jgi:hypothetical protein